MFNFDHNPSAAEEPVITTRELRKTFKAGRGGVVEAVRGVDIDVARGEIFGFLGPNGAGKTTTLRMLTTLLRIDSGSATVAGADVHRQPGLVRARIGYVSQLGGADEVATGRENLVLQGRLYGIDRQKCSARAGELIELLNLGDFADRRTETYSGGQRRRLDVALGLIHDPAVLFLDEPSTGLDPQNRTNLWDRIAALRATGTTVFLTTHYLEEADALCDRVAIIDHGEIVACGAPRALKREIAGESVLLSLRDTGEEVRRAEERLRAASFVRELTVDGAELRLYVQDGPTALPQLLRLLDADGISPRSLSLSEPTLDDVFMRYTGRSLRDAGEAPTTLEVAA
jgi:ABC-2 type transport system ATP-binding protein